jgi:hypothetical protein
MTLINSNWYILVKLQFIHFRICNKVRFIN